MKMCIAYIQGIPESRNGIMYSSECLLLVKQIEIEIALSLFIFVNIAAYASRQASVMKHRVKLIFKKCINSRLKALAARITILK